MHIKRSIKFLLHKRKSGAIQNIAIRMRITYAGNTPIDFPTGHNIDEADWDAGKEYAIPGRKNKSGQPAASINRTIDEYKSRANELFARFELLEKRIPDPSEFKMLFNDMIGKAKIITIKKDDFFHVFDQFMKIVGKSNQWEDETYTKFNSIKNHLQKFDNKLNFETATEEKMYKYLEYLYDVAKNKNTTVGKNIQFVKWFLRWANKKGYYNGNVHETFKPKLKGTDGNSKEVIHLTWEELMKIKDFNYPSKFPSIPAVRDVFLFMCFTGLRHSDVFKLKRSDVKEHHILIVSKKTVDGTKIELNKYSKEILNKYKDVNFKNDKALPVISLQKMNNRLKTMGELAGIDDPQRIVYFRKNKRIEEVYPKHALLTTHCGRRTFIVNGLYLGIPSEVIMKWTGHSDYKAMKPYIKIVDALKEKEMVKFDSIFSFEK